MPAAASRLAVANTAPGRPGAPSTARPRRPAPRPPPPRGRWGAPGGPRAARRAPRHWGGTGFWGYLGWRRFSVLRSLCLPVNLLEGNAPGQRGPRRRAVAAGAAGAARERTLA
ncbi:hypothetical protein G6F31_021087 [Rhizopus arrhizus]|nr:hypothetical protein G6F31_021087 [Rhizopus arrhizus]